MTTPTGPDRSGRQESMTVKKVGQPANPAAGPTPPSPTMVATSSHSRACTRRRREISALTATALAGLNLAFALGLATLLELPLGIYPPVGVTLLLGAALIGYFLPRSRCELLTCPAGGRGRHELPAAHPRLADAHWHPTGRPAPGLDVGVDVEEAEYAVVGAYAYFRSRQHPNRPVVGLPINDVAAVAHLAQGPGSRQEPPS